MRIIVSDWETTFDRKDYTLSKLSTEAYLRDPRFEAHGCAIKWSADQRAVWYDQDQIRGVLAQTDWSDVFMIHHHGQFDSGIEAFHYGVHPRMIGCTLAMARLLLGNHLGVSLDSVRKHFGMPPKTTPYHLFDGKRWRDIPAADRRLIAEGACDEVESIWQLFQILAKDFPAEEYEVVDTTIKMFTEPLLRGDIDLLGKIWSEEETRKVAQREALNVTEAQLQSAAQFAELLEAEGVEVEYKAGKNNPDGSEKLIPCFAKTDDFMRDLQEDDNERVRGLVEARLGAKSTLLQTRAETFGFMASRGPMPVYLRYAAANTTRWGGGDGSNWQNLKRGHAIRRAIQAPEGHLLGAIDSSQIECRLLNFQAGQWDVVDNFRQDRDPYTGVATKFYGRQITKADAAERGTGKQMELSCGYGCGPPKFRATAKLGIYGPPILMDLDEAQRAVDTYRDTHQAVVGLWREAGNMFSWLSGGLERQWGPTVIRDRRIWLPNGAPLIFDTLEWYVDPEDGDSYWRVKRRNGWQKMYGAKLVENWIQALARVMISQAMIRIRRAGIWIANTTHDELLVVLRDDGSAQEKFAFCLAEMKRAEGWLTGVPLDAEGSLGSRYEK